MYMYTQTKVCIFSQVFRGKNPVIKLVVSGLAAGGRTCGTFLVNVLVNLLADSIFSQSIQPAFFKGGVPNVPTHGF